MLVSRGAMADKGPYVGSTVEQGSRDAPAEITGSSRYDDGRRTHQSKFPPGLLHRNLELCTTLEMACDPRHLHFPIPQE